MCASSAGGWTRYCRQVDLFRTLSESELEALGRRVKVREFRPGELIIGPDTRSNRIYIVRAGTVRLFHRSSTGREITADLVGPGQLLGLPSLFAGAMDVQVSAEALTHVVACLSTSRVCVRLLLRSPRIMLDLVTQMGTQLIRWEQNLAQIASRGARARLAGTLSRLAHDVGEELPDGRCRLPTGLTHALLGRQIGARRETVARLLGTLEREGFIRREGRQMVVIDLPRLTEAFGLSNG